MTRAKRRPEQIAVAWRSPWTLVFVALTFAFSLVIQVVLLFPVGLVFVEGADWTRYWVVYALNAGFSGILADQLLRRRFGALVVATEKPPLPLIWLWLAFLLLLGVFGSEPLKALIDSLRPG